MLCFSQDSLDGMEEEEEEEEEEADTISIQSDDEGQLQLFPLNFKFYKIYRKSKRSKFSLKKK